MTNRKTFLAAGLAAYTTLAFARTAAVAAPVVWRFGLDQPATHPLSIRSKEAVDAINAQSAGRLQIQLYVDNTLGDTTSLLAQVRSGAIALTNIPGSILGNVVPIAAMEGVAFAFRDYAQAYAAMDGAFGANIRAAIAKAGLTTFDKVWSAGFHQVMTSVKPIGTPDDLRGLKIRVPPAPLETAMFAALGSSPQPINNSETYVALQTHVVDGAAFPLATIEAFKYYEIQKYLSFTNHIFTSYTPLANTQAMQSLPADLQAIVARNMDAAGLHERADIVALESSLATKLHAQGFTENHPPPLPFRTAISQAGLYGKWQAQYGAPAWALLEKAVGKLG